MISSVAALAGRSDVVRRQARRGFAKVLKRRRFYKGAGIVPADDGASGFEITLDGRKLRSPARRALALPNETIALAIAAEWDAQEDYIEPASMPLMGLASTAVDQVVDERGFVVKNVLAYLRTDTVTYFADSEDEVELLERQERHFLPLLEWLNTEYKIELPQRRGLELYHKKQNPAAASAVAEDIVEAMSHWRLSALQCATTECKSLTLGLALLAHRIDAREADYASRLEENMQIERWGLVEGQHDYDITRSKLRLSSASFFAGLTP
ncbi:hypothetical protein M885DRAFT_530188 [Pelagophyceae sp. CCMP2097]|nr:hypothetical protein M885DRAFT_530188 [Pelagophyceae sp. CCMP2097]